MSSEAKTRSQKEDKPVTCRLCLIIPWILFMFQERMDDFVTIRDFLQSHNAGCSRGNSKSQLDAAVL